MNARRLVLNRFALGPLAACCMFLLVGSQTLAQVLAASPVAARPAAVSDARLWWQHAVFYEIYPRSFQDSNGDGIGDLNGITQRLDYLKNLGVDAIWLSPIYPSPQVDFGYDISNYEDIDPQYGTLADFDRLVAEAKKRNIRIVMDMVMNHTSDKHPWFLESASSKTNPKRDWYVWHDGKTGGVPPRNPPNNWTSAFGHSAWQYDPKTAQYYYHRFYIQQPDLNWRNPEVEKAMFSAVRFWLDRGVAGFRFDAIPTLFEDPKLADAKTLPGTNNYGDQNQESLEYDNLPEVHAVMRRLRAMTDKYPGDRVLIGETYVPTIQALNDWYGGARHDELQLPMDTQVGFTNKLDATLLRKRINEAETLLNGNRPLFVFDNHDNKRSWERYGDGVHDQAIARLLATLLLTTKSTALMYYGEELGMVTSTPLRKADVKDPIGRTGWPKDKGRDGERTPMQWDAGKDAGFSTAAKTWLPVASDYRQVNVSKEATDPGSLLNWNKQLIALRRDNPTMRDGRFIMLNTDDASVISYLRMGTQGHAPIVVAVNCTAQPRTITLHTEVAGVIPGTVKTLITDAPSLGHAHSTVDVTLPPFASWIASIQ